MQFIKKVWFGILVITCLIVTLSTFAHTAKAVGIEVSPARLQMSVGDKPVVSRIQVKNPTSDVQLYEVSISTDSAGITLRPKSFTLQAGGRQEVQLTAEPKKSSEYSGLVEIVARPLVADGDEIGSGVKLPVVIHFGAKSAWYQEQVVPVVVGFVLIVILIAVWFYRNRFLVVKNEKDQ